jgi:hypothetical protein
VAQLAQLVAGLADLAGGADDAAQADRGAGHDHVAVGGVDGGSQLLDLVLPVAHGRQDQPDARVGAEGLGDRADGVRSGVDEAGRSGLAGGDRARPIRHAAVGQGRAVLDDQDPGAGQGRSRLQRHRGRGPDDGRPWVGGGDVGGDGGDGGRFGAVNLVDHHHVGHAQVGLARVVAQLVAWPQRVGHSDVQVGGEEREVVVAAVPDDHVGVVLGPVQDPAVVHAGVHDHALADRLLVLFALLDGRAAGVDVGQGGEPLHPHPLQVAVRHRVADQRDPEAGVQQQPADPAAGLALAGAGAHRGDGDHRSGVAEHGGAGAEQPEVGPAGQHGRGLVHDLLVRQVRVGQHHLVHVVIADDAGQLLLGPDGDAVRVGAPGQRRR